MLPSPACDAQNCGWSNADHRVSYDASCVWNANACRRVIGALTSDELGSTMWEGAETRVGKTVW
jgi:hypothetical protein